MGVSGASGYFVYRDTLNAARKIAETSGDPQIIEPKDLKKTALTVGGQKRPLNYETIKKEADYGLGGDAVTAEEFAAYLQRSADKSKQAVTVILSNGQRIAIEPVVSFDSSQIVKTLSSPPKKDVPRKIDDHFKNGGYSYYNDGKYLLPREFYLTKKGDCNDFSIFAHYILSMAGYSPRFLLIYWPQELKAGEKPTIHDICAYQDEDRYWNCIDNNGLHLIQAEDLAQLIVKLVPNCNKAEELKVFNGRVDVNRCMVVYPTSQKCD